MNLETGETQPQSAGKMRPSRQYLRRGHIKINYTQMTMRKMSGQIRLIYNWKVLILASDHLYAICSKQICFNFIVSVFDEWYVGRCISHLFEELQSIDANNVANQKLLFH